jgi:hypothetical protein
LGLANWANEGLRESSNTPANADAANVQNRYRQRIGVLLCRLKGSLGSAAPEVSILIAVGAGGQGFRHAFRHSAGLAYNYQGIALSKSRKILVLSKMSNSTGRRFCVSGGSGTKEPRMSTSVGKRILQRLTEFTEALESGEPIRTTFTCGKSHGQPRTTRRLIRRSRCRCRQPPR